MEGGGGVWGGHPTQKTRFHRSLQRNRIRLVLTVFGLRGSVVGLVDGLPEAHVAAAATYHRTRRTVEGNAVLIGFLHGCLQTLQGAGLL